MLPVDSPPFRAAQVGSLLRPHSPPRSPGGPRRRPPVRLRALSDRPDRAEELRAREDEAIRAVVAMQEDAGLRAPPTGSSGAPRGDRDPEAAQTPTSRIRGAWS